MLYTLSRGGAQGTVDSVGGELCGYRWPDGRQAIWQGDPAYWAGHSPLLFPIVGSLENDGMTIAGVPLTMPKHGFARKREWALFDRGEDWADMVLHADEQTRANYPLDFELHALHRLEADGFSTTYRVINHSEAPMPFCLGGHPGFNCPMKAGERFEDYVLRFEKVERGENTCAPLGGLVTHTDFIPGFVDSDTLALDHALFDSHDALIFRDLRSSYVDLVHGVTGEGLRFTFGEFGALGIWTVPGKRADYVCLEPWNGIPDHPGCSGRMEEKPYVTTLAPGETFTIGYRMSSIGGTNA